MKKLCFIAVICFAAAAGLGQGTINFVNDTATLSSPPDRFIRFGAGFGALNGQAAYGTNLQVQLYYGTSGSAESALIPLSAAPARLRSSTSSSVGTWQNGGLRTFQTAAPGAQLSLQIRVWDITFGATYEQAASNPGNSGVLDKSPLFGYVVPQPTDPASAFLMSNFLSFRLFDVPEPPSSTLTLIGAAWLLMRRRSRFGCS